MAESQETSDYPGSLDTWVTLTNKEDLVEGSDINKLKAAIEAVQTELGTDPAGTATDVTSRLSRMMNGVGALAQGTSFPVSPTPVEGQVFYRTDENTPYVYDGANWIPFVASSYESFTSSGTFTVPGGITRVYVSMVAAGGGGGKSGGNGGGGAGGQFLINHPVTVTPGDSVTVTVGGGGLGATYSPPTTVGGTGGDSSFGSLSVAGGPGGNGLGGGAAVGGSSTITSMDATGQTGATPARFTAGNGRTVSSGTVGGGGGASLYGNGGNGGGNNLNGTTGSGYGGGGGGAGGGVGNAGKGSDGFVLVAW